MPLDRMVMLMVILIAFCLFVCTSPASVYTFACTDMPMCVCMYGEGRQIVTSCDQTSTETDPATTPRPRSRQPFNGQGNDELNDNDPACFSTSTLILSVIGGSITVAVMAGFIALIYKVSTPISLLYFENG